MSSRHPSRCLFIFVLSTVVTFMTVGVVLAQDTQSTVPVDFQRDVRPILSDNCFSCHGPDESTRQARLRLDTQDGAFSERLNGNAIVAGNPDASLLYQRITQDDNRLRMPPPALSNKTLSDDQVDVLKRWIEEGASWDQHWSFKTVQKHQLPDVVNKAWVRTPIDHFVLARLESDGLEPAAEADKRTLARRVALDITGLPPDPGTLADFLSDSSDGAYEKLVDQLLDSNHWGEHRARYWLDAARYGDTHGIHVDSYREMYPYRDWVINAFNENKPFDDFTIEQLAGDLLPEPTIDQLVATGFHRNNITTNEGGVIPEEYAVIYAKDRAETTAGVYLGLTIGCATCHNHKFDPIQQREFYAMTAFFRNTTQYVMDGNRADPPPIVVVPEDEDRDRWYELRVDAAANADGLKRQIAGVDDAFEEWLATGEYRTLETPLERSANLMRLILDDPAAPVVDLEGQRYPVVLKTGATVEAGPDGQPAVRFGKESWVELPALPLDSDTPFSIAMWMYHPEGDGDRGYVVAGQYDAEANEQGWKFRIGARQLSFRMTGDQGGTASIGPANTQRIAADAWTHIVVTHDGSGERAGMHLYRNGDLVQEHGSSFFANANDSMRVDRPLVLGRGMTNGRNGRDEMRMRYFTGGGIADLRVFNRPVTVDEARVIANWPTLQRAREKAPAELDAEDRDLLRLYYLSIKDGAYQQLLARSRQIEREWREIRRRGGITHVMHEIPGQQAVAYVLNRGMYDDRREQVFAGTPSALPPMAESLPRNRLGLAKWLVDDANPLTSRVTVNRFWQQVFGAGLVLSTEDFGAQGDLPSHPELLDWLAVEFRESDWDVKQFFRTLVTSSTYRQAALITPEKREKDPQNRLLSRGPRFRMDAEMIRDHALAASGLLVRTIGGASVKPYQPKGVWEIAMPSNTSVYEQDTGDKLYRRSLYTFWKRTVPPPSMDIFNAPTREHFTVRRERTNTPLQALATMNDPQYVEASRYLAQRAMREAGNDFDRRLDYVTTRLLARSFDDRERAVVRQTYIGLEVLYSSDDDEARRLLEVGESGYDEALPHAESAAWTMLTSQLMNVDEVLNK